MLFLFWLIEKNGFWGKSRKWESWEIRENVNKGQKMSKNGSILSVFNVVFVLDNWEKWILRKKAKMGKLGNSGKCE